MNAKQILRDRFLVALLNSGRPQCRVCDGLGVVVVNCATGACYRPCACADSPAKLMARDNRRAVERSDWMRIGLGA